MKLCVLCMKVDESNIQTQECYRCHMAVPLRTLREHLNTCTVTAAHDGKPSTEVEVCKDSAQCISFSFQLRLRFSKIGSP